MIPCRWPEINESMGSFTVRTHEGGGGGGRGGGSRKSVCLRTRGRGVLLGQVRTHAKKKIVALFQVL